MNTKSLIIKIADVNVYIKVIQKHARHHLYETIVNVAVLVLFYPNITDALEEKMYNRNICGCACHKKYTKKCSKLNKYLDPRTCYCKQIQTINKRVSDTCKKKIPNLIVAIVLISELTAFIASSYLINTFLMAFF